MYEYNISPASASSPRAQVQTGVPQKFTLDDFDFNNADLKRKHKEALSNLAKLITDTHQTQQPVLQMVFVGRTDSVGSWTYNHSLGLKRAYAAAAYLLYLLDQRYGKQLKFPVPVTLNSEGEISPTAGTAAQNRRVDIWLRAEPPRPIAPSLPRRAHQQPLPPPRNSSNYEQRETLLSEILGYSAGSF